MLLVLNYQFETNLPCKFLIADLQFLNLGVTVHNLSFLILGSPVVPDEVDHGYDNKTENNTDTVEDDVSEVSGLDNRSDSEIVTIEGNVMEVSVPECEVDNRSDNETESDYENELEIVEEEESVNDNGIENVQEQNDVDTVPGCEVENETDSVAENGVISTEGNVTEVAVEPSVLESIAMAVKQNNTTSAPKKRRRRPAGEISGRQRGLKRLKKEQQAGIDEEECDVIFAKKNWPPPFEESVIAMRSSLMQFTKKTEGWTKDDTAELRAYYKQKWKVEKVKCFTVVLFYFTVCYYSSQSIQTEDVYVHYTCIVHIDND